MSISKRNKRGSALLLALVTIVILSALMVSFIFRMHLESELASQKRFEFKAQSLAAGGQEYAKWMLSQALQSGSEEAEDMGEAHELAMLHLSSGIPLTNYPVEAEEGSIRLSILPENSWRNVNLLSDADWEQLLENSGVPLEHHAGLIAQFRDWTDEDDQSLLLGAEEDDDFYQDRELPVKNAPLTAVEELQYIKGFTSAICFGGTLEEYYNEPDVEVTGILPLLTVYGKQSISLQSASKQVLMTLSGIREEQVDQLIEARRGIDGVEGTEDDGFQNQNQALGIANLPQNLNGAFTLADFSTVRIYSIGEVGQVRQAVEAIYEMNGRSFSLLSYREFRLE